MGARGESCNARPGPNTLAAIVMWTVLSILIMLFTWLIWAIFAPTFMTMSIFGIGENLMAYFWLKPVIVEKAC